VVVEASADRIRDRVASGWGTVEAIDDRSCEYRTGDDDLDWLAMRIAMLGAEFRVIEPPELVDRLRALGERLARST
jgi:predicted DNA-binding transcriptional regulator YafY